jgi:hypothetical protein
VGVRGVLSTGQDLLIRLRSVVEDDRDIEHVIRAAAGGNDTRDTPEHVIFRTNDSEPEIFARARIKRGRITALELGEPLRSSRAQDDLIERARRESSQDHGSRIFRRTLFSNLRMDGAFKWKDTVQLRPCSQEVVIDEPQTWMLEPLMTPPSMQRDGPPFPLVLEVRVPCSPNPIITVNRSLRLLQWWQDVLTVFVPGVLGTLEPTPERIWTFRLEDGIPRNRLIEAGFQTGQDAQSDDFGHAAIVTLSPAKGFYDRLCTSDQALQIPDSLPDDLALLDTLDSVERQAFARAAYWFGAGLRARLRREEPVAITSFSAAIESLLPCIKRHRCSACNQEVGNGPTFFFRQHLRRYAPLDDNLGKLQAGLYKVRSALVHGSHVQDVDIDVLGSFAKKWEMPLFEWNARKSLLNWLRASDRSTWQSQRPLCEPCGQLNGAIQGKAIA